MVYWGEERLSQLTVLLIAVALGMDAFSMAVGIGVSGVRRRYIFLVSVVVCLFHILMPLAGLTLGAVAGRLAGRLAGILGACVLISIGLKGLIGITRREMAVGSNTVLLGSGMVAFGPLALVVLAGSVSLDALSVGFGLGTQCGTALDSVCFGAVAGLMTAGGFVFGSCLGNRLEDKAGFAGALILLLMGIKLLFS